MQLVRDCLDKLVVDRHGRQMGRVDGVLIECTDGMPPRISALEIGARVLGERLHPKIGRLIAALEELFGVAEGRPVRISFGDVLEIGKVVKVDVASGETAAWNVEHRLRGWIAKIPGA